MKSLLKDGSGNQSAANTIDWTKMVCWRKVVRAKLPSCDLVLLNRPLCDVWLSRLPKKARRWHLSH